MSSLSGHVLSRAAGRLSDWSGRYVPGSFSIALILTVVVYLGAIAGTGSGPLQCIGFWGDGFWELLTFAMQICLVIFTGHVLASSEPARKVLRAFTNLARTPTSALLLTGAASLGFCWINWGFGLIASAILVTMVARHRPDTDYRVLVATSYLGMGSSWHAGLSGSVPLLLATPGHFLEKQVGIIPISETVFHPFNLIVTGVACSLLLVMTLALHPAPAGVRSVAAHALDGLYAPVTLARPAGPRTLAQLFDHSYVLNLLAGAAGCIWVGSHLWRNPGGLTLNTVNFAFLLLSILLYPSPAAFVRACEEAAKPLHGVVLQFPFYSGIYGIIKSSGLAQTLAHFFISISNERTYTSVVFVYSAILNYFVPSGGSKWAIEAPYLLDAARSLNVPVNELALAYAYGDMATNLIQPFWAIPLLSLAGLEFKDILGYEIIAFLLYSAIILPALLLFL